MREAAAGRVPGRPWRGSSRLMQALWRGRNLRAQLLILFILIEFVAALVAGAVTVLTARTATQDEIAASMELAEAWVKEAAQLAQREAQHERILTDLASQLHHVRHVRIGVRDAAGNVLATRPPAADREPAPAWFAALIAPPSETRVVPLVVGGGRIGTVEIVSEPKDEIAEKWETTSLLAAVGLAVTLAVIGALYVLFGRVLEPLTRLSGGLAELERRHFEVRLDRPPPPELAALTDRFNRLAEALDAARAENLSLNQRLITAQDDERRRTAFDLHDEVGPTLFGLKANASSIAKVADGLPGDAARSVKARVGDLLTIIDHLQSINRGILNRLRPMALGQLSLHDVLSQLVGDRAREYPYIAFSFTAQTLARSYGDSIDLTLYRCVQEGLTNAIRHAQARRIGVEIGEMGEPRCVVISVSDDGRGIDPLAPKGLGSLGMQERVEGLGGAYAVESADGRGTTLRVSVPLHTAEAAGSA